MDPDLKCPICQPDSKGTNIRVCQECRVGLACGDCNYRDNLVGCINSECFVLKFIGSVKNTFQFGDTIAEHTVGDIHCNECAELGEAGYPKLCICGGLVHSAFGDENFNGD